MSSVSRFSGEGHASGNVPGYVNVVRIAIITEAVSLAIGTTPLSRYTVVHEHNSSVRTKVKPDAKWPSSSYCEAY